MAKNTAKGSSGTQFMEWMDFFCLLVRIVRATEKMSYYYIRNINFDLTPAAVTPCMIVSLCV